MSDTAFQRLVDALRDHGRHINVNGVRAMAQCPAHDDGRASLSLTGIEGQALIFCHAGCSAADIMAALNLAMADLFDTKRGATYTYPDGRRVHRKPNKTFPQSGNTKGNSLFHADRIGDATTVYVVEGEKDVLAVEAIGGAAVCSAMGAGKAHLADWSPLKAKDVIIVADKDEPGRTHANQVAGFLDGIAESIRMVEAKVGKDAADHIAAGHTLEELIGAESIDGAELLDDVEDFAGRFLAFATKHHIVVLVLWILHTWAVGAFYVSPRLVFDSPEPGCGKTRVLEVLRLLCRNAKLTLSTTTAALYRRIEAAGDTPPTVLQDEADAVFSSKTPQAEDLRALFNSGYKRGATVDRCEGDAKNMRVREFKVYAPVALAGLAGKMSKTILDRAVVFHMRHRAADEHIAEFRERDADDKAAPLRALIERWAGENFDALAAARPTMPDGVRDRPAEVWEALLAVADVAGGDWPQRAREACRHFVVDTDDDEPSLGVRLLRDLRKLFDGHDALFSVDIISALTRDEESEWSDLWGKPLDQRRLAKELKRYGVRSGTVRIRGATAKGYCVDGENGLGQAWRHFLPPASERHKRPERHNAGQGDFASVTDPSQASRDPSQRHTCVTADIGSDQDISDDVTAVTHVTDIDGPLSPVAQSPPGFVPPAGPGRCLECGWHVPTQGHRDDCPANVWKRP